mmetsp:Transcript_37554/g.83952  ORF Transcript_37554/g.83952 Transcript_37554/m.83952 type:complete len:281 (+) Transcript_37554:702-1544(+)
MSHGLRRRGMERHCLVLTWRSLEGHAIFIDFRASRHFSGRRHSAAANCVRYDHKAILSVSFPFFPPFHLCPRCPNFSRLRRFEGFERSLLTGPSRRINGELQERRSMPRTFDSKSAIAKASRLVHAKGFSVRNALSRVGEEHTESNKRLFRYHAKRIRDAVASADAAEASAHAADEAFVAASTLEDAARRAKQAAEAATELAKEVASRARRLVRSLVSTRSPSSPPPRSRLLGRGRRRPLLGRRPLSRCPSRSLTGMSKQSPTPRGRPPGPCSAPSVPRR